MRATLRLLTALPLRHDGEVEHIGPVGWVAAPVVGVLIGVVWFVVQQLALSGVGPLVAGVAVVGVAAMLTGARGHRGLQAVGLAAAEGGRVPAGPPAAGGGTLAVVLVVVAQVALLQRVTLAPAIITVVPLAGRAVQALLLRAGDDDVGVPAPSAGQKLAIAVVALGLLGVPALLASLERPVRLDGPLVGVDYLLLGVAASAAALVVGMAVRAWLLARFGSLSAAGWHALGLLAETAALVVVAVRIA